MLTDYHVHLERGPLTLDWLKEFVDNAKKAGIGEFGISEHCYRFKEFVPAMGHIAYGPNAQPYFSEWLKHYFKDSLEVYNILISESRKAFALTVKKGIEVDYFPEYEQEIKQILTEHEFDYTLGSVHFIGPWGFDHDPKIGWPERDVDTVYSQYFDRMNAMVLSGLFDIAAHPDVIKVFGHRPSAPITHLYQKLAGNISKVGMTVEVSTAGYRKAVGEIYPCKEFMEILREHNIPIILNSDAHIPTDVGFRYNDAIDYIKSFGYRELATYKDRERRMVSI